MRALADRHPNLATWLVLGVGMVGVLALAARDQHLTPIQWWWLTVATLLLAGLCAWIISWEADDPVVEAPDEEPAPLIED
ncbi:MAG: hypothetical protein ACE5EL_02450 [Anaerolineae bacterium]